MFLPVAVVAGELWLMNGIATKTLIYRGDYTFSYHNEYIITFLLHVFSASLSVCSCRSVGLDAKYAKYALDPIRSLYFPRYLVHRNFPKGIEVYQVALLKIRQAMQPLYILLK